MALKANATLANGLPVKGAYITVEGPVLVKGGDGYVLEFGVAIRAKAGGPELQPQTLERCRYDLGGPNPLEQAYGHLKKSKRFPKAVDV